MANTPYPTEANKPFEEIVRQRHDAMMNAIAELCHQRQLLAATRLAASGSSR
jgi:putative intracellular protease/amidase